MGYNSGFHKSHLIKTTFTDLFTQSSLTRMALHALSRMETRKFQSVSQDSVNPTEGNDNVSDTESMLSMKTEATGSKCVICLEKFKDGQVSLLLSERLWGSLATDLQ